MGNDVEFLDENENKLSQKIDYNVILMEQINKVRLSGSVEFRGGYWEEKGRMISGNLITEKVYIYDTRQVYIGAVDQLYDLLLPYLDSVFKKVYSGEDKKGGIVKEIKELNDQKDKMKKELDTNKYNVWYFSSLLKLKRKLYQELIHQMCRMGLFGIKKSSEVY